MGMFDQRGKTARLVRVALGVAACCILIASAARADFQITWEVVDGKTGKVSRKDLYVAAGRVRIDTDRLKILYRDDTGTAFTLLPARYEYLEFDPATQQKMAAKAAGTDEADRQKRPAAGSENGRVTPKSLSELGLPGASETIGAWVCQVYRKTGDDGASQENCVAPLSTIGLKADDLAVIETYVHRMHAAMPKAKRSEHLEIGPENVVVESVVAINGTPQRTTTLKSVQHAMLPADTFDIPFGYTKREVPGLGP